MSKFKFLAGLAGALALSVGAFSAVPSAEAGREFKKSVVQFEDRGATAEEKRAKRAKRRANRAERRAKRSERRSERRAERRAKRKDRKANRRDRRANRAERRARRAERRTERRANRRDRRARRAERRERRYERRRHGKRFRNRRHSHKHYYNGFYYANPWWLYSAPIIAYGGTRYAGSDYELHVEWCEDRYRSYNERRDAYRGYDGYWHACVSPYS